MTEDAGTTETVTFSDTDYPAGTILQGLTGVFRIEVELRTSLSSGRLAFRWAQNTSDAGTTRVNGGSYIQYMKAL